MSTQPDFSRPRISVVDTTELRWFAHRPLPTGIEAWFTRSGMLGSIERRCDTYRIDGRADVGLKRRARETLELKIRRAVDGELALMPSWPGQLEEWRKLSPADDVVDDGVDAPWIDVCKTVTKRRFDLSGRELAVSTTELPTMGGCDVEVVAITVGERDAWSFALAAFGPPDARTAALTAGWEALVARSPSPPDFDQLFDASCGYPQWLSQLVGGEIRVGALAHQMAG